MRKCLNMALLLAMVSAGLCGCAARSIDNTAHQPIRVAAIGGMTDTGLWPAVTERFTQATGYPVELVVTGPKRVIAPAMRDGRVDLITMHASDTIINLVADGYAMNPQPWLKNDLVLVGPSDDPAGVRGMSDAAAALRKINDSGSMLVVHSSLGAQEVLRNVLDAGGVALDQDRLVVIYKDQARQVLRIAARHHAYTLVGRIPFLDGKMPNEGLDLMVQGDPELRRPYLVAVADPRRFPDARVEAASKLAEFLCSEPTQKWIAEFGRGVLDEQPLFFRVTARP